jgi:hypothetical protein
MIDYTPGSHDTTAYFWTLYQKRDSHGGYGVCVTTDSDLFNVDIYLVSMTGMSLVGKSRIIVLH